jgi:hypothetical protein
MARRVSNQVATLIEAEALALARQEIAHWNGGGSTPWSTAPGLSAEASRAFAREQMRMAARTSTYTRMLIIAMAREGDEDAGLVLRDLILEMRARRQELPVDLENYNMEVLHGAMGHQPPGPKRKNKMLRNISIAMTIAAVVDRFPGLDPTGNSRHRRSACAIVAEALTEAGRGMGQKAVEEVWRSYGAAMPTAPGWASAVIS